MIIGLVIAVVNQTDFCRIFFFFLFKVWNVTFNGTLCHTIRKLYLHVRVTVQISLCLHPCGVTTRSPGYLSVTARRDGWATCHWDRFAGSLWWGTTVVFLWDKWRPNSEAASWYDWIVVDSDIKLQISSQLISHLLITSKTLALPITLKPIALIIA